MKHLLDPFTVGPGDEYIHSTAARLETAERARSGAAELRRAEQIADSIETHAALRLVSIASVVVEAMQHLFGLRSRARAA